MGTGTKTKNLQVKEGVGPQDAYRMTAAAAADVRVATFEADNVEKVIAWYEGDDAIDTSLYAYFPEGSIIFDQQSHKTLEKTGAVGTDAWVASAARS